MRNIIFFIHMTLAEYNIKRENIKQDYPEIEALEFPFSTREYRKIIEAWQAELPEEDRNRIQAQERFFAKKMAS